MQGADLGKTETIAEQPSSIYTDTGKFKAILKEVVKEAIHEERLYSLRKIKDAVTFFFSQELPKQPPK